MRSLTAAAVVLTVPAIAVSAQAGSWTRHGPPAEIFTLAVSPATGTVFAGGRSRLYRSDDHGGTWSAVGPAFPPDLPAQVIVADPTSGGTLYVGFGRDGGFFKSTDGGQTMTRLTRDLPEFLNVYKVAIAPSDSSTIYLAGNGLFRSTDAGQSWTQLSFPHNVYCLAVDPFDARRVLAGSDWGRNGEGDAAAGVWISNDGGESWRGGRMEQTNITSDLAIDPRNPARVYAAMYGGVEIERSDDGGETWVRSSDGYRAFGALALAIDPTAPGVVYANGHAMPSVTGVFPPDVAGIYRSTQAGVGWSRIEGGSRPGTELLAIDPGGLWVYAASFGQSGVDVYATVLDRPRVEPPRPRSPAPRIIARPGGIRALERSQP